MEFFGILAQEFAKSFIGEAGKAGARAIFNRHAQSSAAEPTLDYDPLADVGETANAFLGYLAAADHGSASSLCDPTWADDPERSQSLHDVFDAAAPLSWSIKQFHVPGDWTDGDFLSWAAVEMVITYDYGDGTYAVMPAFVWTVPADTGWLIADISWEADAQADAQNEDYILEDFASMFMSELVQEPERKRVITCSRCPQKLSIPVGIGRIRVKCPACWTQTTIDT